MPRYENIVNASEAFKRLNPQLFPATAQSVGTDDEGALHDEISNFLRRDLGIHAVVHSRMDQPTTTARGVADFLYVYQGKPYAVEAKSKTGKPTSEQLGFLLAAQMDGWTTGVVRSIADLKGIMGL